MFVSFERGDCLLVGVVARLGRRLLGVGAEELGDELERVLRVVHLRDGLEDESIERLRLLDARVPRLQVLLDDVQVGRQVLQVLDKNAALGQVDEDRVAVLAGRDEAVEQIAQSERQNDKSN